jgi:glutathione-regulated potassium-efflux system ancillary protein KefC
MELYWLAVAFALGFLMRCLGLPSLVGFLAAGFVLRTMGASYTEDVQVLADAGVTLMLFMIGLKLKLKNLIKPAIWGTSTLHMLGVICIFAPLLMVLGDLGIPLLDEITWRMAFLIAFALSFSSTVFAVVMFEQKGEMAAFHALVAIGVLIMQDLFAVIFMTASKGIMPSPWAFGLLLLLPARKLMGLLLEKSSHGELKVLIGLLFPIAGYLLFEAVNLKGDLGALSMGVLLASSPAAKGLSKVLLSFKDLFLVTFFLSIGLRGDPTFNTLIVAVVLVCLIPIKTSLFQFLFSKFYLRSRTATFSTLSLSTYSEFGLIVGAVGVQYGWLDPLWLLIFAIAMSLSFVVASPVSLRASAFYQKFSPYLKPWEKEKRLPEEQMVDLKGAKILIFGMGRLGCKTYDLLYEKFGAVVHGLDASLDVVSRKSTKNRLIELGDSSDRELWQRLDLSKIKFVMLTLDNLEGTKSAVETLRDQNFNGKIAVKTRFEDHAEIILEAGADVVYNVYAEAGVGFAAHTCNSIDLEELLEVNLT